MVSPIQKYSNLSCRPQPAFNEKERQVSLGLAVRSANTGYELIIDNFAGGGGASSGIEQAFGRPVDIAINHDGEALAMHTANHPDTAHYQEDVFDIHPGFVTGQRLLGLAWFSPDCKHHSKAKGGKPREKKIRGLAWVTLKWGAFQMPRCIALENVEEFQDWGPLDEAGKPIKAEKGRTFRAFVDALSIGLSKDHPDVPEIYDALGSDFPMERLFAGLGYKVEYRIMRACDYGTPTIRKRLFVFARRDGLPIHWPAPTHGNPKLPGFKESKLKPWRTAAECIDWSIPCPSIFDRKRPLKPKTLDRIGKGIMKFVVNSANPFIVNFSEHSTGQKTDDPLHAAMAGEPQNGILSPSLMHLTHQGADRTHSVDTPLATVTGAHRGEQALISAHITKFRTGSTGTSMDESMHTLTAGGNPNPDHESTGNVMGVVTAVLAPFLTEHANASTQRIFDMNEPLRTQCAEVKGGHFAAVTAILAHNHADKRPDDVRASEMSEPLKTQTTENRHALVTAMLAKHYSGVVGTGVEVPFGTVTTTDHHSVVTANLVRQFGNSDAADVEAPVGTIRAGGAGKTQLVMPNLIKLRGTCQHGKPVGERMATISAQGTHLAEVRAFLIKYYGEGGQWQDLSDPMHTISTKDCIGLVTVQDEEYVIVDIGMRMLTPRELARAQGFPDTYILDPIVERGGMVSEDPANRMLRDLTAPETKKRKIKSTKAPLSKSAQVRMIGNSVCPPLSKALIEVNFTHEQKIAMVA